MNRPLDEKDAAELAGLAANARRARRLAGAMTDLAVRGSLLDLASEYDARIAEITGAADPGREG